MGRRTVAVFCVYIILSLLLTWWLMKVTFSDEYIEAGTARGYYTLTVYTSRGRIYDRNLNIIAGGASEYRAVITPDADTAAILLEHFDSSSLSGLEEKLRGGRPFVIEVGSRDIDGEGIELIKCIKRYGTESLAPHIVGYLDGSGKGAFGIEKAYDELLGSYEGSYKVTCRVNALGNRLGDDYQVRDTTDISAGGVVLTIDSGIQIIAQRAAEEYLESGVIVIMDPKTGEILACVSTPSFDQNDISAYLDRENSPLLNKAFSSYDVGSVFKLVVAAAALEKGMEDFTNDCRGQCSVGNKIFRCSSAEGHGELCMEQAVAYSCNTYFVALAQQLGYEPILEKARILGFGSAAELGREYFTGSGNLPAEEELMLPAGLANFSFGQGSLMANPVQIASLVACIANDGVYIQPSIVKCTVNSNMEETGRWTADYSCQAIEREAAEKLRGYMESVMLYGTGRSVSNRFVSTAAKSGTAETGIRKEGRAVTRGWFAGYFPAENPKFVCVVMEEDAQSGTVSAGPCFSCLAQRLTAIYGK